MSCKACIAKWENISFAMKPCTQTENCCNKEDYLAYCNLLMQKFCFFPNLNMTKNMQKF